MKKLLKIYGFNSDMQYYEMIAESFLNGQITQAHDQFLSLPKKQRIEFLKSATIGGWNSGINQRYLSVLFDMLLKKR